MPKDGLLGQEYFDVNLPVVERRLQMAGVRLAALLNAIFGDGRGLTAMATAPSSRPADGARGSDPTATTARSPGSGNKAAAPPPTGQPNAAGPFVGSRKSKVYHYPNCRDARRIKPENLERYAEPPPGKTLHKDCPL